MDRKSGEGRPTFEAEGFWIATFVAVNTNLKTFVRMQEIAIFAQQIAALRHCAIRAHLPDDGLAPPMTAWAVVLCPSGRGVVGQFLDG